MTDPDWHPHPGVAHDHAGPAERCSGCYAHALRELAESMKGNAGRYKSYDVKVERAKRLAARDAADEVRNKLGSAFEGWGQ
jgi:hypothetical protein